jgi:hypothetical protein
MMTRSIIVGLALAGLLSLSPDAQAGIVVGSQGFSFTGGVSTDNNPSNINTATVFTLVGMSTFLGANNQKDDFLTYVTTAETFASPLTLTTSTPTSFTFGNGSFGTFMSSSITQTASGSTTQSFNMMGTFSPGTDFAAGGFAPGAAEFVISFTQGAPGDVISASASLFSPSVVAVVPEPASVVLSMASILGCGLAFGLGRRFGKATA